MQRATKLGSLVVLVACSGPARQTPPPQAAAPPEGFVEFGVTIEEPSGPPGAQDPVAPPAYAADSSKRQPPQVKLELGHYRSERHGIGLTIDLTGSPAKIRFDHTDRTIELDRVRGPLGRTDYIRKLNDVVLQVWDDGRVAVFVPDSDRDDAIRVVRDADADPL